MVKTIESKAKIFVSDSNKRTGKSWISNYQIPPTDDLSIDDFQQWGLNRIRVLKHIDECRINGISGDDLNRKLRAMENQFLPLTNEEEQKRDIVSHWTLRLAYCRPADRNWFVTQEGALLKWRLSQKDDYITEYLSDNHLDHHYRLVTTQEREPFQKNLKSLFGEKPVYKLPFEQALDLLRQKKVLLHNGDCFVSKDDFASILVAAFKNDLHDALAVFYKAQANILNQNDTIAPFVEHVGTMYFGSDYGVDSTKRSGQVKPADIDMLDKRSFPMCMHNSHTKLRETHHLKHAARMQYGLFLKGIGLSLEDALSFWRTEFTRVMGVDKFDKEYSYNIRHNYGKEGKRTDYTPYSCIKIINNGGGNDHGCPFKNFDAVNLRVNMLQRGVPENGVSEVLTLVKDHHYQIACRKHFEWTHPNNNFQELSIQHPNQYFEHSEKFFNNGEQAKGEKKTEKDFLEENQLEEADLIALEN
ncbi:hypothetical protein PROFUN_04042 [Planoprotostelium fungivorum]|uniref:DNA primase large subunit C-terminal domain-containing protein n=1 Tax=Planoprotostelium fungivorum TaxID=1890364 RepID=A0A2P6NW91_9EUKA|nr:hypothetical protein PROFUN_04042 [Planoprotostelium fungivorum]